MKRNILIKIRITILVILVLTLVFIIIKNSIYGYKTEYIANYMPSSENIINIPFYKLALGVSMERLLTFVLVNVGFTSFYTYVLFKAKIYTRKLDIVFSIFVFLVPLTICFFSIYNQLGYSC